MKKTLCVISAFCMTVLSLTGCGNNQVTDNSDETENLPVFIETTVPTATISEVTTTTSKPVTHLTTTTTAQTTAVTTTTAVATTTIPATTTEPLNNTQKNSIAMLNYLAFLSQEINDSKNSRLFLEEAYSSLINNTSPDTIDGTTQFYLCDLLDIIEEYRMIDVKRERLNYIYAQNKANALKSAMPNPIGLLSLVNSSDIKDLAASAIYMAVDSASSYKEYNNELDLEYLKDGWALDDQEAAKLHENRKDTFTYMVEIVRENNLPGELSLNEKAIQDFVQYKNNTNIAQKVQFFESEEKLYSAFGNYWLELADCYYQQNEYKKCLNAIAKYENIQSNIFRKDYSFAQMIPKVIVAARETYGNDKYVSEAERYLELLIDNTENTEWSLRYFAAQTYIDLYAKTDNKKYLNQAYDITLNNVNYLTTEQANLNAVYLAAVKELPLPNKKDYTDKKQYKKENAQITEYNTALKNKRKTELPPVYEPLVLNCDLLFSLADEIGISQKEKNNIEQILHGSDNPLFLNNCIANKYSFAPVDISIDAKMEKDKLTLPVSCLSENSSIKIRVTDGDKRRDYIDVEVSEVTRTGKTFDSFKVVCKSKEMAKQEWSSTSCVEVTITDGESKESDKIVMKFLVSKYKDPLIGYDTVEFRQVK